MTPADQAAWTAYMAANKAAREQYRDLPIATAPICDSCRRKSKWQLCRRCRP